MTRSWRLQARRFRRDQQAVAALEFAIVFPLLFLIMGGAMELSRAVDTSRRLTTVANSQATMLASARNPVDGSTVTFAEVHYAYDATMLLFPEVLRDSSAKSASWTTDISVSMAGISFTPTPSSCTSNCTYTANVVWTGAAAKRTCGSVITSVSDTASPTPTTLPADLFSAVANPSGTSAPRFALVVDIAYTWTPLIFSNIIGKITMTRSAYITPRYASQVTYSKIAADDGFGRECPGY